MDTILWIVQSLLAVVFLAHGLAYLWSPAPVRAIVAEMPFPPWLFRFLGVAEVLAAFGLILPAALDVLPWLTPLAAFGLALVMAGAVVLHVARREAPNTLGTVVVLAAVVTIAVGRR